MNQIEQVQERWVSAARRRGAMPPAVRERLRLQILERIATERDPAGTDYDRDGDRASDPRPDREPGSGRAQGPRSRRTWMAVGTLATLAAAAIVYSLAGWTADLVANTRRPDAASYEHRQPSSDEISSAVSARRAGRPEAESALLSSEPEPEPERELEREREPDAAPRKRAAERSMRSDPRRAGPASPAVDRPGPDVARESRLLRRAQRSLSADDLSAAQGALDDYARAFPEGVLRPEAAGIAAIVACRRAPNARVVWEFSKQYPGSPLVERVRRSCDPASNK